MSRKRRVVVTGVGLVSCLGHDYETVVGRLRRGESGVRSMPEWGERGLKSRVAGAIEGLEERIADSSIPKRLRPVLTDGNAAACLSALDAVADAELTESELHSPRTGCIVGAGVGSCDSVYVAADLHHRGRGRRINPYTVLRSMSSSPSAVVANLLGIRGRSYSLSSACATATHNLGHAFELIRSGELDRAVTGGCEEASELIAASFQALRLALSTRFNEAPEAASRPYDQNRDGFVVSGGAGLLVLEELESAISRGAQPRAEVIGYSANTDGFDLVLPDPEGRQAAECMRRALESAGRSPSEVDYVNTHGTSTVQGDIAEFEALRSVFDPLPPFSSTKSMTGHAVGAAGGLEAIFCIGMIERGFVAPSINVDTRDPALDEAPLVTEARDTDLRLVASNNFGVGGTNATLLMAPAPS